MELFRRDVSHNEPHDEQRYKLHTYNLVNLTAQGLYSFRSASGSGLGETYDNRSGSSLRASTEFPAV